jgi:phytanoyl-CoA hydroxylase
VRTELSPREITSYGEKGFLVIDDFLSDIELIEWREKIDAAARERGRYLLPGQRWEENRETGEYYSIVLSQRVNLSRSNQGVRGLIVNPRIGRLISRLSGIGAVRMWHDQLLIKEPYSPPTSFHLDEPFWSFTSDQALTIWVALDDATLQNGAMCYLPGVHRERRRVQIDLTGDIGSIFRSYPEWATIDPVFCPVCAGGCIFHHGLVAHGACANMTPRARRAMTAGFFPDGSTFNGIQNILSDEEMAGLRVGDLLDDDEFYPLLYSNS